MVTVTITNLSASAISLDDLYVTLGAAGSSTAAITATMSVGQLDSMPDLQKKLKDGTVSCAVTQATDNSDLLSLPLEQHGVVTGVSVTAATEVTTAVTFAKPFPAGVVPVVTLAVDKSTSTAMRGTVYAESITNTGFSLRTVVTTTGASTVAVNYVATY